MKPIQQRRMFFQTVGKLSTAATARVQQPRASLSLAAAICAALLFCSCTRLTPDRVALLSAIAGQAAQVGVEEWLAKHPTQREAWAIAISAFANAVKTGETNPVSYLKSLPVSSLAGPEGALYVTGTRSSNKVDKAILVVWDNETQKSVAATGPAEEPVQRAVMAGLKRGLAEKPPKLPPPDWRRLARTNAYTLEAPPGFSTNAELTDAELDAQFTAIKAQLAARTNGVCTVDVQAQPDGASVVTVRWTARPGVYQVQQRDEGSVVWLTFGCATNVGEWRTGWHPSLPLGSWRVVRSK